MSPENQQRGIILLLTIYVLTAAIGFLIAYIVKTSWQRAHMQTSTPVVVKTTPFPTPGDWKVYENADAKIELSYPPTDTFTTDSYSFGVTGVSFDTASEDTDFQILILPKSLAQTVGQSFDTYYTMPNKTTTTVKSPLAKDNTTQQFTKVQNRSVNGLQAFDYSSIPTDAPKDTTPEVGTFLQAGSNLILISTTPDNKETLEKMLSSFHYNQ
jgi:hypothetical protein